MKLSVFVWDETILMYMLDTLIPTVSLEEGARMNQYVALLE